MTPLAGIRVVEAASFISGPLASMTLADLGADVIKVERPGGDPYRRFGRVHNGRGILFANCNRGKQSVVIDLQSDEGQDEFRSLVGGADVLLTNWRPTMARGLGFDEKSVRSQWPALVWVRVTGFGQDGPLANAPAFDSIIQARSGLASALGGQDSPMLMPSWLCDKVAAVFAVQAVLAAVVQRQSTGSGSVVDLSMLDAVAYFNSVDLLAERTRIGDGQGSPTENSQLRSNRPMRTKTGWLTLSPVGGRQVMGMLTALGCPERGPELAAVQDQAEMVAMLYELAEERLKSKTTEEWIERFAEHGVPAGPVLDMDEHLQDPQVLHNRTYVEYEDPELGLIRQARYPAEFDGDRLSTPAPAPGLDEGRGERPWR
jgi:crotonobetainyl-CoA:carnitine CoA-transferase CaiB-like acyl-CoA transferase